MDCQLPIVNNLKLVLMPTDAEKIKELEAKIKMYEHNGAARLFYALNKKLNEMADMLNKQSLITLDLTDAKDKTFVLYCA